MLGLTEPILITGCARSGTSMVAGIIERCGAFGGTTCGPTPANRKGQYENTTIRNGLIKPYLKSIGADPMGQYPLPDIRRVLGSPFPDFNGPVVNIIQSQGYTNGPWYFKGAKMCLMWPVWRSAFPDARWIIVRRETEDIVKSCLKTGFMRAYSRPEGWRTWVRDHELRFDEMRIACKHCREVWPSRFIRSDFDEIREIVEWLGLTWCEDAVKGFVDPSLWHGKSEVAK